MRPFRRRNRGDRRLSAAELQAILNASPPYVRLLLARVVVTTMVSAIATPAELLVPPVRAALGRRGVQTGPAIGSLLSLAVGLAIVGHVGREGEQSEDPAPRWDRALDRAMLSSAALLPVAGALVPHTVVARRRSPLWGWLLWALVRLLVLVVLAEAADRGKHAWREAGADHTPTDSSTVSG